MCSVPKLPICIFLSVSSWVHFENYSLNKYDFILLFFKLKQNGSSGYLAKKNLSVHSIRQWQVNTKHSKHILGTTD